MLKHVAKRVVDPGYTAVFGAGAADEAPLGPLERPGAVTGHIKGALVEKRETRPPKRYTEVDWQPFSGHFFQRLRPAFLNSTGLM